MNDIAALDRFALSHGQARHVLWQINGRPGDAEAAFDAWLKHLRREGVPFVPEELGRGPGVNVVYRYEHVMELAVAVALRAQAPLSVDLVRLLSDHRARLWPMYRQAYLERETGLGAPIALHLADGRKLLSATGTYLEFLLVSDRSGQLSFTAPELLGPADAMRRFANQDKLTCTRSLLPLSALAIHIVGLAGTSPEIRRGRP